ncbi:MAG: hypothetical protein ACREQ5_03665 [Candidatus Dormibacteria bacterium]
MAKEKKKKDDAKGLTGFEFGAKILEMSVDALVDIYKANLNVTIEGIKAGKTNAPLGLMSELAYFDLLHGGAYAAPVNARPWYLKNPSSSKYFAGDVSAGLYAPGVLGWITGELAGTTAVFQANEILTDANVPHVFPKLLSDEAYAVLKILYNQAATTELFTKASTGVATLVEGITKGAERSKGDGGSKKDDDDDETEDIKDVLDAQGRAIGVILSRLA